MQIRLSQPFPAHGVGSVILPVMLCSWNMMDHDGGTTSTKYNRTNYTYSGWNTQSITPSWYILVCPHHLPSIARLCMRHGPIAINAASPGCVPTTPYNNNLCAWTVRSVAATSVGTISDRSRPVRFNDIGSLVFPYSAKYCR